jgi:hypothetical protein
MHVIDLLEVLVVLQCGRPRTFSSGGRPLPHWVTSPEQTTQVHPVQSGTEKEDHRVRGRGI